PSPLIFSPMSAATLDTLLPAELAEQLDEAKRQAVLEAPRSQRLAELATALGQSEGKVIEQLAELTGLTVATNLQADLDAMRLFPARLVHDYQMVPILTPEAIAAAEAAEKNASLKKDDAEENEEAPPPTGPLLIA